MKTKKYGFLNIEGSEANKLTTNRYLLWSVITVIAIATLVLALPRETQSIRSQQAALVEPIELPTTTPFVWEEESTTITKEMVKKEIIRQAEETGVDVRVALRIAQCESSLEYDASNLFSTAKGVYQFTNPTWKWIKAEGDQYDYKENIKQFMKWYPVYPGWWECR